jgi:cytochrome c
MKRAIIWILASAALAHSSLAATMVAGDAKRGQQSYQICSSCHSIDENDVGPMHRGVVGRHAAAVPGYAYSAAMKRADLVWNLESLDRWLINPQAVVPGSRMYFSVGSAQARADIIAYLASQRGMPVATRAETVH